MAKAARKPNGVGAYIAAAPRGVQAKLKELRAVIRKTAPAAVERISYGIPYYDHKGRLAYFAHWKTHIGLYIPTPVLSEHKDALKGYKINKATVQFPLDRKLPVALIRKLIRARMKKNEDAVEK